MIIAKKRFQTQLVKLAADPNTLGKDWVDDALMIAIKLIKLGLA